MVFIPTVQKEIGYRLFQITNQDIQNLPDVNGVYYYLSMLNDVRERVFKPMLEEDSKVVYTIVLMIQGHEQARLRLPMDIIRSVHSMLRGFGLAE